MVEVKSLLLADSLMGFRFYATDKSSTSVFDWGVETIPYSLQSVLRGKSTDNLLLVEKGDLLQTEEEFNGDVSARDITWNGVYVANLLKHFVTDKTIFSQEVLLLKGGIGVCNLDILVKDNKDITVRLDLVCKGREQYLKMVEWGILTEDDVLDRTDFYDVRVSFDVFKRLVKEHTVFQILGIKTLIGTEYASLTPLVEGKEYSNISNEIRDEVLQVLSSSTKMLLNDFPSDDICLIMNNVNEVLSI